MEHVTEAPRAQLRPTRLAAASCLALLVVAVACGGKQDRATEEDPEPPGCDPVSRDTVCSSGVCGRQPAGCPGAYVVCDCPPDAGVTATSDSDAGAAQAEAPRKCQPRARELVCQFTKGSACGEVEAGCPGVTVSCGCDRLLSCQGGVCMPRHRACDPVSKRQACGGDVCGRVSAGCPGAFVTCSCSPGKTCHNGRCQ